MSRGANDNRSRIAWPAGAALLLGAFVWGCYLTPPGLRWAEDYRTLFHPHFDLYFDSLRDGRFPWWNPYIALGRPLLQDIHYGFLYPLTYLLLLGEKTGLFLILWLHTWLLWLGCRRLARELGANENMAGFAGLAVCLSAGFSGRLLVGQLFYYLEQCYAPWLIWWLLQLRRGYTPGRLLGLSGTVVLAFLCGNTNVFWCLSVGAGLFWIACEWFERKEASTSIGRTTLLLAIAGAIAIGLSAIAWIPYLDLVAQSNRSEPNYEFAAFGSAAWSALPTHFSVLASETWPNWERCFFVGSFWSIAGIAAIARCRSVRLKAAGVLLVFAGLYSLGDNGPLHRVCYAILPGTNAFRVPPRMMIWTSVLLPVAAAVWLSRSRSGDRTTVFALVGFAMFLVLLSGGSESGLFPRALAAGVIGVASAGLLWFTRENLRRTGILTGGIVGLVLLCEFAPFILIQRNAVTKAPETLRRQEIGERHLAELAANFVPPSPAPIRIKLLPGSIPGNGAIPFRIADVNGSTPLYLDRPWRFLHQMLGLEAPTKINSTLHEAVGAADPRRLPFLSIDAIPDEQHGGFQTAPGNWPRAWFSSAGRLTPRAEVVPMISSGFPAHQIALVEQAPPFPIPAQPPVPVQPVAIEAFELNRIVVGLTNQHAGYLVLNEVWFPGWKAVAGDYKVNAEPVNVWMRGFPLPPGTHRVEITFRPRHWSTGVGISLATLAVCVGILIGTPRSRPLKHEVIHDPAWNSPPLLVATGV